MALAASSFKRPSTGLIHSARLFSSTLNTRAPLPLSTKSLSKWDAEIKNDPTTSLAATVVRNHGPETSLINRDAYIRSAVNVYSDAVSPQGAPVVNQKQSGRCWLYAATNVLRVDIMRRYNLEELELSPSFLFFYDKLEKANFFLDQIEQTANENVESRVVQHLLTDPICDGGQYDMFANIIQKYGLVPNHVFPDSFNTLASNHVNEMVTTLLRQFAQEIRSAVEAKADVEALKTRQIKEVHRLLTMFLGSPPGPTDPIVWQYVDKDKNYHSLETTPLGFYNDVIQYDTSKTVSLLNDPRNTFDSVIEVDRLGNVIGKPYVRYLNVDIDTLSATAVSLIQANKPVFFGTHTPLYHDKKSGIIDTELWDHKLIGFNPTQSKADRLRYHQSLMTHAMVFSAVHLDPVTKQPVRWKVENSWGEDVGIKGCFVMSHDYFKEYVYQVVAQREDLSESLGKVWDTAQSEGATTVLPPWDPCGALAKM